MDNPQRPVLYVQGDTAAVAAGLALLAEAGDIRLAAAPAQAALVVTAAASTAPGLHVTRDGARATVTFDRPAAFFRGLSHLLDGTPALSLRETPAFDRNGLMVDCARNAVPRVSAWKRLIRRLALMGLSTVQLYLEDVYTLPDYPYFGWRRGRYTDDDLKEIDAYAAAFGMEAIPCIQTLAHLACAVRWPDFRGMVDWGDILLAGEQRTYAFIEAEIARMAACFRSRRINIGMDEAYLVGLGVYRERNGIRPRHEILGEHLRRVVDICARYGRAPLMWSDMFFYMANSGQYYTDRDDVITPAVAAQVPAGVTLLYWDYYGLDSARYDAMLRAHQRFDNPVIFAGGAWKWQGLVPQTAFSLRAARAALDACRRAGLREVFATAWGDDGDECPLDAVLPIVQYYAESDWAGVDKAADDGWMTARFAACTGGAWADFLLLGAPDTPPGVAADHRVNPTKYLLYQDVLQGLFDRQYDDGVDAYYAGLAAQLTAAAARNPAYGEVFAYEAALCALLAHKATAGRRLRAAYAAGDRAALARFAGEEIPVMQERLAALHEAMYAVWTAHRRIQGFDTLDRRLGALRARLDMAARRVSAYVDGRLPHIPELEEPLLWFDGRQEPGDDPYTFCGDYSKIASVGSTG